MRHASRVRRGVRIETRRLAVVAIVDDGLIAEDPGARGVFPGRIHQSGIGRVNVVDRLMSPGLVRVHAGASSSSRPYSVSDDCMPEMVLLGGEGC
jgi:hypothetical protein